MKSYSALFLAFFIIISASSIAQDEDTLNLYKPDAKDFGAMINVSGLISNISAQPQNDLLNSSALLIRYKINENFTFRTGVGPQIMRVNQTNTDSIGQDLVEYDSTASQSMVSIFPGIEYHLEGTKRLDPYLVGELELGLIGRLDIGAVENTSDTTGTSKVTRTISEDGGFALGARVRLGMNYFIAKNLFFGVEYGMGVSSRITGGDREDVIQIEPVSGASTVIRDLSSSRTNNLLFAVDPMVNITFGYFF